MGVVRNVRDTFKGAFVGILLGLPFGLIAGALLYSMFNCWGPLFLFVMLGGGRMSWAWTDGPRAYERLDYGGTFVTLIIGLGVTIVIWLFKGLSST